MASELLGVGYIIGPRIASIMMAGGVLASLVLTPAIRFFGDRLTDAALPRPTSSSSDMSDRRHSRRLYILYIGAGAWRPAASSACSGRCR